MSLKSAKPASRQPAAYLSDPYKASRSRGSTRSQTKALLGRSSEGGSSEHKFAEVGRDDDLLDSSSRNSSAFLAYESPQVSEHSPDGSPEDIPTGKNVDSVGAEPHLMLTFASTLTRWSGDKPWKENLRARFPTTLSSWQRSCSRDLFLVT